MFGKHVKFNSRPSQSAALLLDFQATESSCSARLLADSNVNINPQVSHANGHRSQHAMRAGGGSLGTAGFTLQHNFVRRVLIIYTDL